MSASAVKGYDPVFDGQKHYRTLLDCTARPGTIGEFRDANVEVPSGLHRATALIVLALFSADTTFAVSPRNSQVAAQIETWISRETAARPVAVEEAEFVILPGGDAADAVVRARIGTLAYPDLGATVIAQVEALRAEAEPGDLRFTLQGPGIETEAAAAVRGASETLFVQLQRRNAEFPLGVDAYLTCDGTSPRVLALPRTTRVRWKRM